MGIYHIKYKITKKVYKVISLKRKIRLNTTFLKYFRNMIDLKNLIFSIIYINVVKKYQSNKFFRVISIRIRK